jgi:YHS domain-containing protein
VIGKLAVQPRSAGPPEGFHTLCKRVLAADPAYFPRAEYCGKPVYFCTEACLNAFLADPERFFCAHGQPRKSG